MLKYSNMSDRYLLVKYTFGLIKTSDLPELQNVVDHSMVYVTLTILHMSITLHKCLAQYTLEVYGTVRGVDVVSVLNALIYFLVPIYCPHSQKKVEFRRRSSTSNWPGYESTFPAEITDVAYISQVHQADFVNHFLSMHFYFLLSHSHDIKC